MILHLVRILYGLVLAAGIGGLWLMRPEEADIIAGLIITLVLYAPLLFFIPGVVRGDSRQLTWLCFVLMFYFCAWVVQAFYPPPVRWLALLRIALLVGLYVVILLAIRAEKRR